MDQVEEQYGQIASLLVRALPGEWRQTECTFRWVEPDVSETRARFEDVSGTWRDTSTFDVGPALDDAFIALGQAMEAAEHPRWQAATFRLSRDGTFHLDFEYPDTHSGASRTDDAATLPRDEERVVAKLRAAWDKALREQEGLSVRIEMLTADGTPGQPLAYDIFERTDGSLATYTLVELPVAAAAQLGMEAVSADEARQALVALAVEAQRAADVTIVETVILAQQPAPQLGVTWGYHRLPDGGVLPFETSYRHWFVGERLLDAQRISTNVVWRRMRFALSADEAVTVTFS